MNREQISALTQSITSRTNELTCKYSGQLALLRDKITPNPHLDMPNVVVIVGVDRCRSHNWLDRFAKNYTCRDSMVEAMLRTARDTVSFECGQVATEEEAFEQIFFKLKTLQYNLKNYPYLVCKHVTGGKDELSSVGLNSGALTFTTPDECLKLYESVLANLLEEHQSASGR